jgi:DNA-directed RNA polymerase specialized sigma24 family protein
LKGRGRRPRLQRAPPAAFALPARKLVTPPRTDQARWFSEEVHPHRGALRAGVQPAFPGVRDVDDVVQDSLLRIWTARAGRQIGCARAFLFKIARHRALDLLRHDQASPLVAVRGRRKSPAVVCHSERSEKSSDTTPRGAPRKSKWILRSAADERIVL